MLRCEQREPRSNRFRGCLPFEALARAKAPQGEDLEHVPPKCEAVWRDMLQHIELALLLFGKPIPACREAR